LTLLVSGTNLSTLGRYSAVASQKDSFSSLLAATFIGLWFMLGNIVVFNLFVAVRPHANSPLCRDPLDKGSQPTCMGVATLLQGMYGDRDSLTGHVWGSRRIITNPNPQVIIENFEIQRTLELIAAPGAVSRLSDLLAGVQPRIRTETLKPNPEILTPKPEPKTGNPNPELQIPNLKPNTQLHQAYSGLATASHEQRQIALITAAGGAREVIETLNPEP